MTMIGSFLYSIDSAVGIDVSRAVISYFNSRTRTMIYSGFWKYWRTYSLRFLINLLYWFLASAVPKTAPKLSTSPLKLQIYDVYSGRLKFLPQPPRPWWPPLHPQPPRPFHWTLLLELGFLVVLRPRVVVSSPLLFPTSGGVVSVSVVMNFPFWKMLNFHYFPSSLWDITWLVCS